ncbi:hypothetical protein FSP39_019146 [Pinctada imbricata]|uniref:lysoplasmalogenase n=1 Tax=Pinctada imbricata TaxID=66713 RepID=A0AA89BWW8_PINIB|nr:hypothetical protein FSP39_019146 [Pinctada imbricata]
MAISITRAEIQRRLNNKHLFPFYALFILYYILYTPFWSRPPVTFTAAFFKVLPVWALAGFVRLSAGEDLKALLPKKDYHRFLMIGLLFSSLGDAVLVSIENLFIPGMLLFSFAHIFYSLAIGPGADYSRLKSLFILGCIGSFLFLASGMEGCVMQILVMVYSVLIFTVGWRATSKFEVDQSYPSLFGCVGILLFLFSDFIIGVNKWKFYVPFNEFIIMTTYYVGQLGIALSADLSPA